MNKVATELGERTKELVFRAHENAKKHGFHDKKIDLEQAVMLIVSEVGEAIEAHRIGRYAKIKPADTWAIATQSQFEFHLKNCYEDEIADVLIRLFDLAGYFGIVPKYIPLNHPVDTHAGRLMYLTMSIISIAVQPTVTSFNYTYSNIVDFCDRFDINILPFIEAKMQYNEGRPYKHGKEY
jgi:NTP pyrophosphatase (non-canonical NTP hydrolase)